MTVETRLMQSELGTVTDQLVRSYSDCGLLHHLAHEPLPNREAVNTILADLFEIVFPGYGRKQNLNQANIGFYIGGLLDAVHVTLTEQTTRALRHDRCRDDDNFDCENEARHKALDLLRRLPHIRSVLEKDVEAAFRGDPAARSHHEIIFSYPGLEAIATYRLAHELHRLNVPYIPRMMTEAAHMRTGIDIHPGAKIGPGFFIDHGTGVVIGETCDIGEGVKLYQGVTLGALSFDRDGSGELVHGAYKRHPTLCDNVVVYANATILGGLSIIGEGAVIGSNVWITKSVEPYAVVILDNPQHKIKGGKPTRAAQEEVMYFI
jgi:serine O-acetyltransferase